MASKHADSRVRRALRRVGAFGCIAVGFAHAAQVHGQGPDPSFGFWIGAAFVPAGLDSGCSYERRGKGMTNLGAFVVVPAGLVALEARAGGHLNGPGANCLVTPVYQLGTRSERIPALRSGGFAAVDLRLRWLPTRDGAWRMTAGGGWAGASKDIPYLTAGVGIRQPAVAPHVGLDLEFTAYRVPWIERTVEASQGTEVETSQRRLQEWAPAIGVRLSIEIPVHHEPTAGR